MKRTVESDGLEARSPKEAVRQAARIGLIASPEDWIACLKARNDSVHNYFVIPKHEYAELSRTLLELAAAFINSK